MLFEEIIFGPIRSRRLGTSLGVNLLPTQKKICNFDCIYCECGWNADTAEVKQKLPPFEEVASHLQTKCEQLAKEGVAIDSFTFAGNGEPTIHPQFPEIAEEVIRCRNQFFPNAKITVLSNSTALSNPLVFEALQGLDNPILKLDCGTEETFKKINQFKGAVGFQDIVNNLIRFGKTGIIQTLLFRGISNGQKVDNTEKEEFAAYLEILKKIQPRYVMLYGLDRATPEKDLEKLSAAELESYADQIRKTTGLEVKCFV